MGQLTLFGGFGAFLCCLALLLEATAGPPEGAPVPLVFGSMSLRRPPKPGPLELLLALLGVTLMGYIHLRIYRQARLFWVRMEEVRLVLEEMDRKLQASRGLYAEDLDLTNMPNVPDEI